MRKIDTPRSILLDTNILLRAIAADDLLRQPAVNAMRYLDGAECSIHVCPQNMHEFRQVATRPISANGLGWTSQATAVQITDFEQTFLLVPETPSIYPVWRQIVEVSQALGRANFDARLVAIAKSAGIEAVLTFEAAAFAKYAAATSGVSIIHPQDL